MIGMKSVVEGASIEHGSIVAAGAIVTPGTVVPAGQVCDSTRRTPQVVRGTNMANEDHLFLTMGGGRW